MGSMRKSFGERQLEPVLVVIKLAARKQVNNARKLTSVLTSKKTRQPVSQKYGCAGSRETRNDKHLNQTPPLWKRHKGAKGEK